MENVRKRTQIKLIQNPIDKEDKEAEKKFNKAIEQVVISPYVKTYKVLSEDKLLAVESSNKEVKLCKPVVVGFSVLELSKLEMYDFHYNKFKKYYKDNLKMLMTDTDSFIYEIKTDDLYSDLEKFKDDFDFSNLDKKHPLYNTNNKKVVGKMKIETGSLQITEFCGIRSKCYSYILDDNKVKEFNDNNNDNMKSENKKCKGIKTGCVKNEINHLDYYDAIHHLKTKDVCFNSIQSKSHCVNSVSINKIAICPYDDKRLLKKNMIDTYAIGHYKTIDDDY